LISAYSWRSSEFGDWLKGPTSSVKSIPTFQPPHPQKSTTAIPWTTFPQMTFPQNNISPDDVYIGLT
jgi:hypothetical protein